MESKKTIGWELWAGLVFLSMTFGGLSLKVCPPGASFIMLLSTFFATSCASLAAFSSIFSGD